MDRSALASVSMGYQVGVTPLQMVAAVSAIANGGELIEPRIVRAVYRDNRRYAVKPKVIRRVDRTVDRRDADDDHGIGRDGRHREARQDRRLHGRRQDRHGVEADQRPLLGNREQRVVRRIRAVAQAGAGDHRDDRRAARERQQRRRRGGADLQAHRRRGAAVPRRRADDQSRAAGPGSAQRSRPASRCRQPSSNNSRS